jgi:hypothetical protein
VENPAYPVPGGLDVQFEAVHARDEGRPESVETVLQMRRGKSAMA